MHKLNAHSLMLLADIMDAGNLSLAARRAKMSRANISYHLAQLEKSVGQQLIRRTTRSLAPTELGLKLYQHACHIRNELEAAQEAISTLGKSLHGSVRLSVPTGFGALVMSDWLIDFKKQYPHIALNLLFENKVDDLLRDEVDIAIRVMSEPPQALVATELARVRYVVCASQAYTIQHGIPDDLQGLAQVPIITSAVEGTDLRVAAYKDQQRYELRIQPTLASENFAFLRSAILADLGVGLVPDYVIADDVHAGRAVQSLLDWNLSIFGTRMYLLRMPGRYQTLATRTVIDYLVAKAQDWFVRNK